jgi:hypothetical protein
MDIEIIKKRIKELKDNRDAGEAQIKRLEAQTRDLQATLLRIGGAIQVLEEVMAEQEQEQAGKQ